MQNNQLLTPEAVSQSPYDDGRSACIHLGFFSDQEIWHAFPSDENHCHLQGHVYPISEDHQVKYCFTSNCADCPMYLSSQAGTLPKPVTSWVNQTWIQHIGGAALVWLLLGWMVRVILH